MTRDEIRNHVYEARHLSTQVELVDLRKVQYTRPQWPSGVTEIDQETGGFYGFTAVAGYPKLGKSLLSLRSGMMAAREGWDVVYINAENDPSILLERMVNCMGCQPDRWPESMDDFDIVNVNPGVTLEAICEKILEFCPMSIDRLLLVFDSLTSIARYGESKEHHFFDLLAQFVRFCHGVTRRSKGQIACLAINELNRKGGFTGGQIEYAAECLLKIGAGPEIGTVELDLTSRMTAGRDYGTYERRYHECAFRKAMPPREDPEDPGF